MPYSLRLAQAGAALARNGVSGPRPDARDGRRAMIAMSRTMRRLYSQVAPYSDNKPRGNRALFARQLSDSLTLSYMCISNLCSFTVSQRKGYETVWTAKRQSYSRPYISAPLHAIAMPTQLTTVSGAGANSNAAAIVAGRLIEFASE